MKNYRQHYKKNANKRNNTMCLLMSLSLSFSDISAILKIKLSSTADPFCHPVFLLQCSAIQTENTCTKWILTKVARGWQAIWKEISACICHLKYKLTWGLQTQNGIPLVLKILIAAQRLLVQIESLFCQNQGRHIPRQEKCNFAQQQTKRWVC